MLTHLRAKKAPISLVSCTRVLGGGLGGAPERHAPPALLTAPVGRTGARRHKNSHQRSAYRPCPIQPYRTTDIRTTRDSSPCPARPYRGEVQTAKRSQSKDDNHPALDLSRRKQSRLCHSQWALSFGRIRTALKIKNVIRHVAADLQKKRNQQRRNRGSQLKRAIMPRQRAAHHHA